MSPLAALVAIRARCEGVTHGSSCSSLAASVVAMATNLDDVALYQVAPQLLPVAIAYLDLNDSGDAGQLMPPDQAEALRAILEPLRPKPPTADELSAALRDLAVAAARARVNDPAYDAALALLGRLS